MELFAKKGNPLKQPVGYDTLRSAIWLHSK